MRFMQILVREIPQFWYPMSDEIMSAFAIVETGASILGGRIVDSEVGHRKRRYSSQPKPVTCIDCPV